MSMKIKKREEWDRVRSRGHWHWILWNGLVGFALPLIAVILTYLYMVELFFPAENPRPWWVVALATVVLGTAAGYIVADWLWHGYEERFG
jgi:hypothetical protein